MSVKNILVERKDKIGIIILNQPEKRNTFNISFAKELNSALWELEKDDDIRVIVIKAAGKHFSNGKSTKYYFLKKHKGNKSKNFVFIDRIG